VLDEWAARRPDTGVGLLADALALAGATGGSQVGALRSVGDTLREREALHREVGAMAAQAQLSASVLVVAPVAFAIVVSLLDRRIAAFLLASPLGWACLAVGAALDGAGAWWMRRLVGAVT
jgi:tight adherence protein B